MRAIIQRVSHGKVTVEGKVVGECGPGLLALVAVHRNDGERECKKMADRLTGLRIFNDSEGKMNLSLRDLPPHPLPSLLVISNFTVYGDTAKGRRPSFVESAGFEEGQRLFELLLKEIRTLGFQVASGSFGTHMDVSLVNDGPVTVILEV